MGPNETILDRMGRDRKGLSGTGPERWDKKEQDGSRQEKPDDTGWVETGRDQTRTEQVGTTGIGPD
jgi:hypothetical protein